MWPMRTRIQQIRARLEAAVDAESYMGFIQQLANDGVLRQAEMDLHRFAPQDISDLLAVVEVYEDCLTKIEVELGEDDDNIYIAEAREALTKAKEILSSSESWQKGRKLWILYRTTFGTTLKKISYLLRLLLPRIIQLKTCTSLILVFGTDAHI